MIHALAVDDYRGFEKYRLHELAMVILLVGPNKKAELAAEASKPVDSEHQYQIRSGRFEWQPRY